MVNKENYYQEYKGHTKWLNLISMHFAKNNFFGMTLLHAHAQYIEDICIFQCKIEFYFIEWTPKRVFSRAAVATSENTGFGVHE